MRLSEKLFLWFSALVSVILALVLILAALQKQGLIEFADGFGAREAWESLEKQLEKEKEGETLVPGEAESEEGLLEPGETEPEEGTVEPGEAEPEEGTPESGETEPEMETPDSVEEGNGKETGETETLPPAVIDMSDGGMQETEADPYPYYIKVNKKQNCITIYEKDEAGEYTLPVRAMICSTGYATPLGIFGSKGKYVMKGLIHGVFGQYSTWITGNILFHSVPSARATKDSVSVRNYNQLGTTASAGCVRLTVADAKWIYDNCEIGTQIEIYEEEEAGPLGKPDAIKLPEGSGWDPTDPDPENPWHEHEPEIEAVREKVLYWGEEWKPYEDMKAYDTCGNEITEQVEITGEVDCFLPGEYEIRFTVTDAVGKTASADTIYRVLPVPYFRAEEPER